MRCNVLGLGDAPRKRRKGHTLLGHDPTLVNVHVEKLHGRYTLLGRDPTRDNGNAGKLHERYTLLGRDPTRDTG